MLHVIEEPEQTITVDAGHRIEIEVAENASTAYVWHVAIDSRRRPCHR